MNELLTDSQIKKHLGSYKVAVPNALVGPIRAYISMLLRWNNKISLTTVTDPLEILKFHFGESLFASAAVPIKLGRLADVGSGAGFPGLPLAMLLPQLEVVLIDSNLKKATFLSDLIRTLAIDNVKVWRGRAEQMPLDANASFDFVTARALGHHDELLAWANKALPPSGRAVLWVGGGEAARVSTTKDWNWLTPMPIPDSERRVLLVGSRK